MDPISFTASLLTLITAAGQSCKVISEFVLDIHDAPKDIYAQSIKLQCLQQSFHHLLSVFAALPPDLQLDTVLQQNVISFTQEIDRFTAKVQGMGIRMDQGRVQHAWERVRWLASDRDLKRFNQSLDHWDRVFAAAAAAAQLYPHFSCSINQLKTNTLSAPCRYEFSSTPPNLPSVTRLHQEMPHLLDRLWYVQHKTQAASQVLSKHLAA